VTLPEPRYVVTELKGFSINPGASESSRVQGLSCHVIDRHQNYRLLATYRTEDRPRIGRTTTLRG
jgi:hypothetical protein